MKKFDFDFYKNRKILFGISIGLMVIGLIFNFIRGTKMDIQFVGGAMIKYSVDGEVDTDRVPRKRRDRPRRFRCIEQDVRHGREPSDAVLCGQRSCDAR